MTVSEQLAREAQELTFEQLPAEVVHEVKRRMLDTLACGIGGSDSPPGRTLQDLFVGLGGPAEATIFGSGARTSAMNAALINGVMVRFTEAMDLSFDSFQGVDPHGHPAEVIPPILAVGERQHSSGKDIIVATVLGYQLLNRLSYAMGDANVISSWGWKHEIRANYVVPLVAGKLMGLSEGELVNAVGISGAYSGELGILDHGAEEVTMARDLRFPYASYQAILATLMAQRGLEGPSRIYEGHHGFAEVVCGGRIDLERLTRREADFNIMYTATKWYPVNGRLPGQIEAILQLVTEHDISPESISHMKITTSPRVLEPCGDPESHRYPPTKETADHSAYFLAALAVVDRGIHLNFDQFTDERLHDTRLKAVIDKTELAG